MICTAGNLRSRQKVFITAGCQTRLAEALFFGQPDGRGRDQAKVAGAMFATIGKFAAQSAASMFDSSREYLAQTELYGLAGAMSML
jgi:hypothetical protein